MKATLLASAVLLSLVALVPASSANPDPTGLGLSDHFPAFEIEGFDLAKRGRGRGRGGDDNRGRDRDNEDRDDDRDDDDNGSGSGRDKPRIPGGSGCDDPGDILEHPECRV